MSAKFGDIKDRERFIKFAAVIELFHLATLIHDDVIDDSDTRRGKPSLHVKYGKRVSVLSGDYLFLKCYNLISKYVDFPLVEKLSELGLRICAGEIDQAENLFDKKASVLKYLKRISGKTAALFSFCFYLGAVEGGLPQNIQNIFGKIGYSLGISFQIMDDILDFTKRKTDIGKNVLRDINEGVYTLPLIYAMKENPVKLNPLLDKKKKSGGNIKKIIRIITEYGGIKRTINLAEKYTVRALKFAEALPDSPVKEDLTTALKELLKREF